MNKKRSLPEELNIVGRKESNRSPLDIDVKRIRSMVADRIDSSNSERKSEVMKSKKKVSLIAIAATLILGITVFAASGIITTWYSSSSSVPEYKSLPTKQQCIDDIGYAPVLIETFENGYEFYNGSVVNNNLADENDKSVEKFKSVMFRYKKDGDKVIFSQDKFNSQIDSIGDIAATVDGTDIYYYSYTNKLVPPDYKMTDEDKKAEANGELVFSWGSSEVSISEVQSVSWTQGGIRYHLMQMDGKLSAEELTDMAEEVIRKVNMPA